MADDERRDRDQRNVDLDGLAFTPEQHERLKEVLHGEQLKQIAYSHRRYLVAGEGGDGEAATRRMVVCGILNGRPDASAFRLEDFGLTSDDLPLWAAAFEILCEQATHIVGVIEDYDGGYVWELGLTFYRDFRHKLWILRREYADATTERDRYDNGMAASQMAALTQMGRVLTWRDEEGLRAAVDDVP